MLRAWSWCNGDGTARQTGAGSAGQVILVPDARQSVCRLLEVPDAPQDQIQRMVGLRLEVELPYPPDQSTWACRRLPGDGSSGSMEPVLLIAQATASLESAEAQLAAKDLSGASVVFAAAALIELAKGPEESGVIVAAAHVERDRALLAISRQGALCYTRHLRIGPERAGGNGASEQWLNRLIRELKQCLLDYGARTGFGAPAVLRIAGDGISHDSDYLALEAGLEMPVEPVSPPPSLAVEKLDALDGDLAADFPLATGALLGYYRARIGTPVAAPLLRPARPAAGLRLKRSVARLLAINAALVLALVLSFSLVQRGRLAAADRFVRESKGLVHEMEVLKEEVDILRYEEGQRVSILEILMALGDVLPPELKVESLNLDPKGHVTMTGTAKSVESVSDALVQGLKQSPRFKDPQFKGASPGKDGFSFTLTFDLAGAGEGGSR